MHCGDAEALAIIDKQVTEFCLTEAARVGQNSLKDGLKVAWRTGDRAEYLGGRRLLLQRLGKVPPHLGELTGARFELLFQLAQRIGPVANARFRPRSGRTKLAAARWTICAFARQGHLVGTVIGPPSGRPSQGSSLSILTEPHDELAALHCCGHSITSSARASSAGGNSRPSAFAVVRLIARSNLVGCSTGMSAGFAPRKILSTNSPARRNRSV